METFTIKVKDDKTERLIRDLAAMELIEIINPPKKESEVKLSDLLWGSVAPEDAENMHKQVQQMRDEWERDTY